MSTQLTELYEQINSAADIKRFVDEAREEGLHLEFKQKQDSRHPKIDDDDRRKFSQALSAFANADGGVLVLGVETSKTPDRPDHATALKPFADPVSFCRRLSDSLLQTVQPAIDGVRIDPIEAGAGVGYVKCLVPASDKPPHRAMHAQREYWRRTSTGSRKMEHYELEDMFGRRLRPVLRVGLKLIPRPADDPHEELRFTFINEGRGLARHAGLLCRIDGVRCAGCSGGISDATAINDQRTTITFYDPHVAIHPNGLYSALGVAILKRDEKASPLRISVKWYAEHMLTRDATLDLQPGPEGQLL